MCVRACVSFKTFDQLESANSTTIYTQSMTKKSVQIESYWRLKELNENWATATFFFFHGDFSKHSLFIIKSMEPNSSLSHKFDF